MARSAKEIFNYSERDLALRSGPRWTGRREARNRAGFCPGAFNGVPTRPKWPMSMAGRQVFRLSTAFMQQTEGSNAGSIQQMVRLRGHSDVNASQCLATSRTGKGSERVSR